MPRVLHFSAIHLSIITSRDGYYYSASEITLRSRSEAEFRRISENRCLIIAKYNGQS